MQEEYNSLLESDTWIITKRPENHNVISSKWVFAIKQGPNGEIDRFKARLVARGFTQVEGVDYFETYSPVAKMSTIRIVLSLATAKGMVIKQLDVKTAFLNGPLDEEIFMEQPMGFECDENSVCKLKKSIYGYKQASRQWNLVLNEFLLKIGFKQIESDKCVYKRNSCLLVVYVNDMLLCSDDEQEINSAVESLGKEFAIKNLGEPQFCLGMRITRDLQKKRIFIDQEKYCGDILKRFGFEGLNPISTPMEVGLKLPLIEC